MDLANAPSSPAATPPASLRGKSRRKILLAGSALASILLDQATKEYTFSLFAPETGFPLSREALEEVVSSGAKQPLIEGFLWLAPRINPGAAFSLLSGIEHSNLILMGVSISFILILIWLAQTTFRRAPAWAFGLLIGGSLGNLIDRIRTEGVLDFIHLGWWPTFNIADAAIVTGVGILLLWLFFFSPDEEKQKSAKPA